MKTTKKHDCIIIDNDPQCIETITSYLLELPGFNLVKTYNDPVVAMAEILNGDFVDLVITTVDMPRISGIELAREISNKTRKLVFVAGHASLSPDAGRLPGDGCLEKPFPLSRFAGLLLRLFPIYKSYSAEDESGEPDHPFFFVKGTRGKSRQYHIAYDDVVYVESKLNYVEIHLTNRTVVSYIGLSEIAESLNPSRGFYRFQRSFIISEKYIDYIEGNTIHMIGSKTITAGSNYRKSFVDFVAARTLKPLRRTGGSTLAGIALYADVFMQVL